ncbi:hypothetical protein U9M48_008792 [Paspalum notatum var. saurae]|uniref:histidine kinase n=1 Tax=Paspalum notatum var. saurae TaxID=547442 RepID=A0AAQ3SPZ4_PASNO
MTPNGTGQCGGGCRRGKAAHAGAGAVAGFFVCLLVVWAVGGCGRLGCGRVAEEAEGVVGQFNLSRSQLEALVSLLYRQRENLKLYARGMRSNKLCTDEKVIQIPSAKISQKWSKRALLIGVLLELCSSVCIFSCMHADVVARRIENLANMCDERARMLQDQFNVSMNHLHALAILVSTFHHGKNPSAIDQKTSEDFAARTTFERPLMSGVAYALKVLHSEREQFEQQHGWKIKKMKAGDQSLVHDYNLEKLEPSPVQDGYAPVIFSQKTVKHIIYVDMMFGKEYHDNILRSRATGKGALTSPFKLLKSNNLGVVLTFTVYKYDLPTNAAPKERIHATLGKQKIVVELYDTTNHSSPIKMYGSDFTVSSDLRISSIDFGDPTRKHEMHCRFKHEPPLPWSAITISTAVAIIVLLVGYIIYATLSSLEKAEHDYRVMRELKGQAEAVDVAKSLILMALQFLATVSHEIRTPMNGVLGMLQMLMDNELDTTQQDFVVTAQESGNALINLINEVLDPAKIESGRIELEAVPFDVRDILDNVVSLFYEKSQTKGIELAVLVSDQVPDVLIGDPWRFRQIITNLVGNSTKFTEQGPIFVQLHLVEELMRTGNMFVDVSPHNTKTLDHSNNLMLCNTLSGLEVADSWKSIQNFRMFKNSNSETDTIHLVVRVEDTGIGITKDAQMRIFTPFMQADSSTSRTYGGTGIGLSITKRLVELMGGEIGFMSKSGIGSTFSFTAIFKKNRNSPEDIKRYYSEPTPSDFQGMRALIIDGRNTRAEITMYHLRRLGIQCNLVATSESAFSALLEACTSSKRNPNMALVETEAWGKGSGLAFYRHLVDLQLNGTHKSSQPMPKIFLLGSSISPAESDYIKLTGYGVGVTRQHTRDQSLVLQSVLNGKQILVVDDNSVNRKVATSSLKKYGAVVTCVDSGNGAIDMLKPPHTFDACFMDVQMPEMDGRDKQAKVVRTKWWKPKGEASEDFKRRVIAEGSWEEGKDADNTWGKMATCIRKVAAEVLGVTKGSKGATKDTWWWNEHVQKALKEKKECYKCVFHDRSTINIERKTRDLNQVKCIKDERGQFLVKEDIKLRWREYFDNMFNALEKHRVPTKYVALIKDMYNKVVTSVRTTNGDTNDFPINIGLYQGSALRPYLFAFLMDEVTRNIQEDILWCMLFADDIVLVDESQAGVNRKLELWRHTCRKETRDVSMEG